MKMICFSCRGLGVLIKPSTSQIKKPPTASDLDRVEKVLCNVCKGTGEVESGYMARHLGLAKENLNEDTSKKGAKKDSKKDGEK